MKIEIEVDFLEHLLCCLANQKFIGKMPPCGDALAMGQVDYEKVYREMQQAIDQAYHDGWKLVTSVSKGNQP